MQHHVEKYSLATVKERENRGRKVIYVSGKEVNLSLMVTMFWEQILSHRECGLESYVVSLVVGLKGHAMCWRSLFKSFEIININ